MMAQYMWVDANVNFDFEGQFWHVRCHKSRMDIFYYINYLSLLLIYFIVLALYYFKILLKSIE